MAEKSLLPTRRLGTAACGESGQAMIELALMLPLFALMLLGAVELGRVAYAGIEISNAARSAVQFGCQNATTALDGPGMAAVASADAGNLKNVVTTPSMTCECATAGTTSSIACTTTASTNCTAAGGYAVQNLQVFTSVSVDPLVHLPGLPTSYTLRGHAVHEVLQ